MDRALRASTGALVLSDALSFMLEPEMTPQTRCLRRLGTFAIKALALWHTICHILLGCRASGWRASTHDRRVDSHMPSSAC